MGPPRVREEQSFSASARDATTLNPRVRGRGCGDRKPAMRGIQRPGFPRVRESGAQARSAGARKCVEDTTRECEEGSTTIVQSASARKDGEPNCSEEQGLRRLVRKRGGYRIDGGHGPIQEYAQHVRVGVTLSTAGPQASGITLDRARGSFLESNGYAYCKLPQGAWCVIKQVGFARYGPTLVHSVGSIYM